MQLGKNAHGVSEYSQVKVRLIKFLHQELGFDVIAFESSIFECFYTNQNMSGMAARQMIENSLLDVWHTKEVELLFDAIMKNRSTNNPLTLAGFDVQITSTSGKNIVLGIYQIRY